MQQDSQQDAEEELDTSGVWMDVGSDTSSKNGDFDILQEDQSGLLGEEQDEGYEDDVEGFGQEDLDKSFETAPAEGELDDKPVLASSTSGKLTQFNGKVIKHNRRRVNKIFSLTQIVIFLLILLGLNHLSGNQLYFALLPWYAPSNVVGTSAISSINGSLITGAEIRPIDEIKLKTEEVAVLDQQCDVAVVNSNVAHAELQSESLQQSQPEALPKSSIFNPSEDEVLAPTKPNNEEQHEVGLPDELIASVGNQTCNSHNVDAAAHDSEAQHEPSAKLDSVRNFYAFSTNFVAILVVVILIGGAFVCFGAVKAKSRRRSASTDLQEAQPDYTMTYNTPVKTKIDLFSEEDTRILTRSAARRKAEPDDSL